MRAETQRVLLKANMCVRSHDQCIGGWCRAGTDSAASNRLGLLMLLGQRGVTMRQSPKVPGCLSKSWALAENAALMVEWLKAVGKVSPARSFKGMV